MSDIRDQAVELAWYAILDATSSHDFDDEMLPLQAVKKCIDAYEAALWQPIDTIKDGDGVIMRYENGELELMRVLKNSHWAKKLGATNWRPLPAPPVIS